MEVGTITIYDDINSSNLMEISSIYNKSTKVLKNHLSMPTYDFVVNTVPLIREKMPLVESVAAGLFSTIGRVNTNISIALATNISNELALLFKGAQKASSTLAKFMYWARNDLKFAFEKVENTIFIDFTPNEDEMYAFYMLSKIGNTIVIYDKEMSGNYNSYKNVEIKRFNTKERLGIEEVSIKPECVSKDTALSIIDNDTNEDGHLLLALGVDIDIDNAIIDQKDKSNTLLMPEGIKAISPDEIAGVPKPIAKNIASLSNKIGEHMFARSKFKEEAVEFAKMKVGKQSDVDQATRQLIEFICCVRKINDVDKVIVFGKIKSQFVWALEFLKYIKKSVIIVDCSGSSEKYLSSGWEYIKFSAFDENHPFPVLKTTNTIAYDASKNLEESLFGDSALLHTTRQCKKCNVSQFNTTFDEIRTFWNEENIYRPGFEIKGEIANIPVIFAEQLGLVGGSEERYKGIIGDLITDHTVVCYSLDELINKNPTMIINHFTNVNGTSFDEQIPFYRHGFINKGIILSNSGFTYRHFNVDVQQNIVDKIAFIIENKLLGYSNNKEVYEKNINTLLGIFLNIPEQFYEHMQWYDFTKQSPKLILLWNDNSEFKLEHAAVLMLLHFCGWDIFVSSANGNNILNNNIIRNGVQIHIEGEFVYGINIRKIEKDKKKGWISRLLNNL